jgi:hypothetical protein
MPDTTDELLSALQSDGEPQTVESMAARLPAFSREAVAQALDTLAAAGVLRRERRSDGTELFHYANPRSYKLVDVPVIRRPDGNSGRRP